MKKLLLILLLVIPIAWWIKDPDSAKSKLEDWLHQGQDMVNRLMGVESADEISYREKKEAQALAERLPEGVYLLKQDVTARFLPVPGTILRGTKVKVIGQEDGKPLITDGSKHAVVDESWMTRDAAEFPSLLRAAQDGQQASKAKRRAELEVNLQQIESKISSVQRELSAVRLRDAVARGEGKKHAQYGTQENFLITEIQRQEGFREGVLKQISALNQ